MAINIVNPISVAPFGVVPNYNGLRSINTSTVPIGAYVLVAGSGTNNDGGQSMFTWNPSSSQWDDGFSSIVPTGVPLAAGTFFTGAWTRIYMGPPQSGIFNASGVVAINPVTGYYEGFASLSGQGPAITYTLPPSNSIFGSTITIRNMGVATSAQTGIITGNGIDIIYDSGVVASNSLTMTLPNQGYTLLAARGYYIVIDHKTN